MILSSISEQKLNWQDLVPSLEFHHISSNAKVDCFDLQPKIKESLRYFLQNNHRTLLVLKADEQAEYASILEQYIREQLPFKGVSGVKYDILQGDSFSFSQVILQPATSLDDNFAAKQSVATALYFDQSSLFGSIRLHPASQDIQLNAGLLHQVNNGVLILSIAGLLKQFDLWQRLKQILISKTFDWYSLHPFKTLPCDIPSCPLSVKVILLGTRSELATLAELEEELYALADYAEIESYFSLNSIENNQLWADYVQNTAKELGLPSLDVSGLNQLYALLVRESEDRQLINISPLKLKAILADVAIISQKYLAEEERTELSAVDFERYFFQKQEQQNFLQNQSYADILKEQIYVATEGEIVGQINGLSVIEYQGTPISFGEPSRISCVVQFGDGEVIDVERKSELAGNIHGKGIMIAETCLAGILNLPSQLPFSASIAFEQSYGEIDGDSASLAGFAVLVSALSDLPLPQSIAVTGAIDQLGLVHVVGGVNQKIEGFFAICQQRGLTGEQGVIIPSSALNQLSLSQEVISAVKNNQFSVWAVEDVFQSCEILFKRHFVDMDETDYTEDNQPIIHLITERLERHSEQQNKSNLWDWLRGKK